MNVILQLKLSIQCWKLNFNDDDLFYILLKKKALFKKIYIKKLNFIFITTYKKEKYLIKADF